MTRRSASQQNPLNDLDMAEARIQSTVHVRSPFRELQIERTRVGPALIGGLTKSVRYSLHWKKFVVFLMKLVKSYEMAAVRPPSFPTERFCDLCAITPGN
jgi:hypothetical protein